MREQAIEQQINKLDSINVSLPEQKSNVGTEKKVSTVELDSIKNEFREVDFHPLEAKPPDKYNYSVNFENVRHTLNSYLRRPIKKAFTSNTKKLVIMVS